MPTSTQEPSKLVIARGPAGNRRQALIDDVLAADAVERLVHDERTRHLDLAVAARGGVLHVSGTLAREDERALVRRVVRGLAGVYAAWDLLEVEGDPPLSVADIGCGGRKQVEPATGVDRVGAPGVDVVADLEGELPFEADAFDHVFAIHVLEHMDDLVATMSELHRVLRSTGVLHVLTPHWRHVNAVADPTHRRYMDVQTFKYFCIPHPGMPLWRPLIATADEATVHADLQPVKQGPPAAEAELARWFD